MRDTFISKIGERNSRPYDRLWIEDSFDRLNRNGFKAGTGFEAVHRAGLGIVIRPSLLSRHHVSQRRNSTVLSYEARGIAEAVHSHEVRIKVCVKSIVVMPSLRLFSLKKSNQETWMITESELVRGGVRDPLATAAPMRFDSAPSRIDATLSAENVIYATEVIGNCRPGEVSLSGDGLMITVGGQFLAAAGYSLDGDGIWKR